MKCARALAYFTFSVAIRSALCRLTIAVYTCSASCVPEAGTCQEDESPAYVEEYVFVQPPLET